MQGKKYEEWVCEDCKHLEKQLLDHPCATCFKVENEILMASNFAGKDDKYAKQNAHTVPKMQT